MQLNHRGTVSLGKQSFGLLPEDNSLSLKPKALLSPSDDLPTIEEEFKNILSDIESQGGSSNKSGPENTKVDEDGHELKSYHKKDIRAIASVFFRFSHRDRANVSLTNKQ